MNEGQVCLIKSGPSVANTHTHRVCWTQCEVCAALDWLVTGTERAAGRGLDGIPNIRTVTLLSHY